jgi:alpha-galactosidase
MRHTLFSLLLVLIVSVNFAQKKDLARTPPMGWNSWNYFACDVSEKLIMEIADAMAEKGMKDAGYEYIVIDDCWQVARDEKGILVADPVRFPSGMKALADYVHSKGLKFGLYSDAGKRTCEGRPGSYKHEKIDAQTFSDWGVDYIKYDWCAHGLKKAKKVYPRMGKALQEVERDIVFSVCNWGWDNPWEWAPEYAHLWRTTPDIKPCFDCKKIWFHNVIQIVDKQAPLSKYAGPGAWNDPDMLQVGNGSLTENENIAHFSMWAMMAAPLMAGNDLRNMPENVLNILANKEVIAVNQDLLGVQGYKIRDEGKFEIWLKPLQGGDKAICFFNRSDKEVVTDYPVMDMLQMESTFSVRDLWEKKSVITQNGALSVAVAPRSVKMYRVSNDLIVE